MKVRNIVFSGAMASILMMGVATAAEISMNDVKDSLTVPVVTAPAPTAEEYEFTFADGETMNLASGKTAADFDNYVAESAANSNENISLTEGKDVKLGNTMAAADYKYASKDADGASTMVAGNTAVTDLSTTYESSYGNIDVSTGSDPVVDIANYTNGEYSLHINETTGEIELYQNGVLELDSPTMLTTLKTAYENDVAGVGALKEELDGYKQFNTNNFNAVANAVESDNNTIAGIGSNKATWQTATDNFGADTNAYNNAVAAYDNSLGKVINDKVDAEASVRSVMDKALADRATASENAIAKLNGNAETEGSVAYGDAQTLASAKSYADAGDLALSGQIANEAAARASEDAKLQSAIDANRNDIAMLDSKMNDLDENLSAGIASSVALSSVAVANVQKGEMSVGGGYGNYNSKSAMAFGAALGITDNWSANAGVGFGFGKDTKASFRVGTNYKFKLF